MKLPILTFWERVAYYLQMFWTTMNPKKQKQTKYKKDLDWQYVNPDGATFEDAPVTAIGLMIPEYEGVLYHYHKARVVEEGEGARLQFGFTILSPGTHDIDELQKDGEFEEIMGEILSDIIMAQQKHEQTRIDNTEEPNIQ